MIADNHNQIVFYDEIHRNEKYKLSSTELTDEELRIVLGISTGYKPIIFYMDDDKYEKLPNEIKEKTKRT